MTADCARAKIGWETTIKHEGLVSFVASISIGMPHVTVPDEYGAVSCLKKRCFILANKGRLAETVVTTAT
jgi:hypothetical protein